MTGFKDIFNQNFMFGSIYTPNLKNGQDKDFVLQNFNVLTAENIMKPMYIGESEGVYNWEQTDEFIEFAIDNNMKIIGHTFVWHEQSPDWLTTGTRAEISVKLEKYITDVMKRYKGKIMSWDVCNEVFTTFGEVEREENKLQSSLCYNWRNALRTNDNSRWSKAFSQDDGDIGEFIYLAFKYAREADPDTVLYYNDFCLDYPAKREATYQMVKELNEKYAAETGDNRKLIEGIGMQSHYNLVETDIQNVRDSIDKFASLGVRVSVTELDVAITVVSHDWNKSTPEIKLTPEIEEQQANMYSDLFKIYLEKQEHIERVTLWGCDDGTHWRQKYFPTIRHADLSPKLAYHALVNVKNEA